MLLDPFQVAGIRNEMIDDIVPGVQLLYVQHRQRKPVPEKPGSHRRHTEVYHADQADAFSAAC